MNQREKSVASITNVITLGKKMQAIQILGIATIYWNGLFFPCDVIFANKILKLPKARLLGICLLLGIQRQDNQRAKNLRMGKPFSQNSKHRG